MLIVFLFFPRKQALTVMQIVSLRDKLHEMPKPVLWEEKEGKKSNEIFSLDAKRCFSKTADRSMMSDRGLNYLLRSVSSYT